MGRQVTDETVPDAQEKMLITAAVGATLNGMKRTNPEAVFAKIVHAKAAIRALEYTCKKPEVMTLMNDPVFFISISTFITNLDPLGLRLWVNKTMFGIEDATVAVLRRVASRLKIPYYATKTKDELAVAIAEVKCANSHKTEEDLKDEEVIDDDPEMPYLAERVQHRGSVGGSIYS